MDHGVMRRYLWYCYGGSRNTAHCRSPALTRSTYTINTRKTHVAVGLEVFWRADGRSNVTTSRRPNFMVSDSDCPRCHPRQVFDNVTEQTSTGVGARESDWRRQRPTTTADLSVLHRRRSIRRTTTRSAAWTLAAPHSRAAARSCE